jgi:tetratricopeptide (TPR) repeat protein
MVLMIAVSVIHTTAWIGINSSEKRSIARFSLLQDGRFWGKNAITDACDVMAGYYRDRNENEQARDWFARYLAVDSTNGRIWAAAAQIYSRLGDQRNQKRCYEKGIESGTKIMAVYMDLGIMYANQKQYDTAIGIMRKALAVDTGSVFANEYMGEYYIEGTKSYREALPSFLRAIDLDPMFARAYLWAGECYRELDEPERMTFYWKNYLRLRPDAPEGVQIRAMIGAVK